MTAVYDDEQTTVARPSTEDEVRPLARPAWLVCHVCGTRIALASARMSFDGGHAHRFKNPHDFEFRIGLFDDAPGCRHEGEPTEYFSWFPGYTWQIANCGECRRHLGWVFRCIGRPGIGEPAGFHGLIVDRLRTQA